jgi:DNA repair protein RadD
VISDLKASRTLLVAPTGSGKTVMGVELAQRLGVPTLWLAHRKELIDQAAAQLRTYGLTVGEIMAGYQPLPLAPVQVASVQTLVRRNIPPVGLVVIDEAHHAAASTYQTILDECRGARVIGLTATPFRLDGKGLGDLFDRLVVAAYTDDLCHAGTLHAPKVWASSSPDLRGIKKVGGDYAKGALAERTNTDDANADIVQTWKQHAYVDLPDGLGSFNWRKTVAFAVDVQHSKDIAEAFNAAGEGIVAEYVTGSTSRDERDAILRRLRDGRTHVVANCMVLTEGWDLPTLECAIIARPTASLNLHLQMIGRIMRSTEGKDGCIVLDHAGNHHVHGLVTRRISYSLDTGKKVGFEEPLGLRRCKQCGLFYAITEFACPECGWTPTPEDARPRPAIHGDGELVVFDDAAYAYRREVWNLIEAQREIEDFKHGWSLYRYKERFGDYPVLLEGELVDTDNADMETKERIYCQLLLTADDKGFKVGWASYRYKDIFGCWPRGFVADARRDRINDKLAGVKE